MQKHIHISHLGWAALWLGLGLIYFAPYGCLCGPQPTRPTCTSSADCKANEDCTHGSCVSKPPASHCQLKDVLGYCIDYFGADHSSAEHKNKCTADKGTFTSFAACPRDDLVGRCLLDGNDTNYAYYANGTPSYDAAQAEAHCKDAKGKWNPAP